MNSDSDQETNDEFEDTVEQIDHSSINHSGSSHNDWWQEWLEYVSYLVWHWNIDNWQNNKYSKVFTLETPCKAGLGE